MYLTNFADKWRGEEMTVTLTSGVARQEWEEYKYHMNTTRHASDVKILER